MAKLEIVPRPKKILRVLNIALVNVVVFLVAFLAVEFATRTYSLVAKGRSFFRQDTFISCWITSYDYPPPMVNADGKLYFRHRETPTSWERPENTLRIIAVGGSTTICLRAYRDAGIDYPMELERRLAHEFPDINVEVLNAGADAYSTAHSLVNIQFRLVELNPDVILLMENINDSSVNYFLDGATPDYSNKYLQSYFLNPSLQGTLSFTGLLTQSRFLSKFGVPQMLANKPGAIHLENDYRYGLHLFSRNLANIAAVCSLSDIELVFMSQPSSRKADPFVSDEAFLAYNHEIAEVAIEKEVGFVDMYSLMGHDDRYFYDKVHYTVEGVERFSEILFSQVASKVPGWVERGAWRRRLRLDLSDGRHEEGLGSRGASEPPQKNSARDNARVDSVGRIDEPLGGIAGGLEAQSRLTPSAVRP